ncbi:hypothetical protein DV706_02170 [Natronorubrum bangense]|uniref:Uncharacterized protein n=2 Tax=Natronorubrum bangense TaxID=61858 RepID=L9WFT9_9EURY|nr:hypothetical protein C494_13261 [Natronorubrum bangense JCM 10635]QCC53393.1 hypothetical protein DV706_02170 [Natronorubrum bangense]
MLSRLATALTVPVSRGRHARSNCPRERTDRVRITVSFAADGLSEPDYERTRKSTTDQPRTTHTVC